MRAVSIDRSTPLPQTARVLRTRERIDWFGHTVHEGFSVAGNMLAGPQVIEETARAYRERPELPFTERLIEALAAGEAAGGDKRGKQSAALLIVSTEVYPYLDIRVDDNPLPFKDKLPTAANPSGVFGKELTERIVAEQAERDRARLAPAG
jgi:uncharacterized Ntn-hydrolase superfamily protein